MVAEVAAEVLRDDQGFLATVAKNPSRWWPRLRQRLTEGKPGPLRTGFPGAEDRCQSTRRNLTKGQRAMATVMVNSLLSKELAWGVKVRAAELAGVGSASPAVA